MFRALALSGASLLLSCSLLVEKISTGCGNGQVDPGEICFEEATLFTDDQPTALVVGDIDGDGFLDFASVHKNGFLNISFGDGEGGFPRGASALSVGNGDLTSIALGDVDNDGVTDLLATSRESDSVLIAFSVGQGSFSGEIEVISVGGVDPVSLALADFVGDGTLDLITANEGSNDLSVIVGDNTGGFPLSPQSIPFGAAPLSVAAGDIDEDGDIDLLVGGREGLGVQAGLQGSGLSFSFSAVGAFGASEVSSVALVDLNGDESLDIVSADVQATRGITAAFNSGAGAFFDSSSFPLDAAPSFVTTAEVNGIFDPELIFANPDGALGIFPNEGRGAFLSRFDFTVDALPSAGAAGDFNGDGVEDLLVANGGEATLSLLLSAP